MAGLHSMLAFLSLTIATSGGAAMRGADVVINVDENVTVLDSYSVLPPVSIAVQESITVNDHYLVLPPVSIAVQEDILVSDDVLLTPALILRVSETITVSDNIDLLISTRLDFFLDGFEDP